MPSDKIMMTAALLAGVDMDQRVKPISAAGILEHVGYRPIVNRSEVEADLASTIRARRSPVLKRDMKKTLRADGESAVKARSCRVGYGVERRRHVRKPKSIPVFGSRADFSGVRFKKPAASLRCWRQHH
jgi:hypothetical protein